MIGGNTTHPRRGVTSLKYRLYRLEVQVRELQELYKSTTAIYI